MDRQIAVRGGLVAVAVAAALHLYGCRSVPAFATGQAQELSDVAGTIEAVNPNEGWYGIVPDGDRGTRYAPDHLPDEFKQDGLRIGRAHV